MSWQDLVLSAGGFVFILALIPSILGKDKPALATSLLSGSVLLVFSFVYFSLSLWLATVFTLLSSLLWLTLAIQQHKRTKS